MCTDSYGQLGHGDAVSDARLRVVEALRGHRVAKVACGDTHVLALTIVGDVWAWGGGEDGQLGLPEEESCDARCCLPRHLSILKTSGRDVCHVAAGLVHSVALPPRPSAAYAVHARVAALEEQLQTVRVCCALFNAYSVIKELSLPHTLSLCVWRIFYNDQICLDYVFLAAWGYASSTNAARSRTKYCANR